MLKMTQSRKQGITKVVGLQSLGAGVSLWTSSIIAHSAGCTLHMHDPVTSTVLYSEH